MTNEAAPAGAPQTPEEKLESVRLARAELRRKRDAEAASTATAAALAAEERALRDEQAIVDAEKTLGKQGERIYVVSGVGAAECDIVIMKRADPVAFKFFQDLESPKVLDFEKLVSPCVVYPAPAVFDRLISIEQPALLLRAARGVSYLAGMRKADEQGKA